MSSLIDIATDNAADALSLARIIGLHGADYYNGKEDGNCYETAIILGIRSWIESKLPREHVLICHGVLNSGIGPRYLHAWVEIYHGKWWFLDCSIVGGPVRIFSRDLWYKACGIDTDKVRRYTAEQVKEIGTFHCDHCGPWHKPLDGSHDDQYDETKLIDESIAGGGILCQ